MDTNKVMPLAMKAEFESAFRAMFGFGADEIIATGDDSAASMMGAAAWAWQASREAVVVQLPARMSFPDKGGDYFDGGRNGYNQCLDACTTALQLAGFRVGP